MKKFAIAIATASTLALAACGGNDSTTENNADTNLEATSDEAVADVSNASEDALNAADSALDNAGNAIENAGEAVENAAENTAEEAETNGM